jgi:single stranded DNA-binding protein
MGYQKFIAMGNVTREPEVREVGHDKTVARFGLAVNEGRDFVEFFDIEWWNPSERALDYITTGMTLLVEGKLNKQTWEKDGIKRSNTVVKAFIVQFAGGGKRNQNPPEGSEVYAGEAAADEIPF